MANTDFSLMYPLFELWDSFARAVPSIIGGLFVIAVGYVVGAAFGFLTHRFLEKSGIDHHVKRAGVAHSIGFVSISNLAGGITKWYVFSLFLIPASEIMRLGTISTLLRDLATWIPDLIAAVIILLVGLIISDYIADRMLHAKRKGVKLASSAVRWFLIFFVAMTALDQIGINISFATTTSLILVAGFALGLAIALGLGFGFALKEEAKTTIKHIKKNVV
ncbi:hypothetical protein HYU11_04255 [Candidatus Woesearchaeota archaeon]|nr:hypothetical protein [Candidatus Woesearchaeota archaeon]